MSTPQVVGAHLAHKKHRLTSRPDNSMMNSDNKTILCPLPAPTTRCPSPPRYSSSSRATLVALALATLLIAPLISCQTYENDDEIDCKHYKRSHASRQQRQFNNNNNNQRINSNPTSGGQQQQQQQQQLHNNIQPNKQSNEMEHEEFSLALGNGPQQQQQVAHSNYTLLPANQSGEPIAAAASGSGSGPGQAAQESTGSAKDSSPEVANTTPALPNDSIGSPVAVQAPPATTSASIASSSSSSPPVATNRVTQPTGPTTASSTTTTISSSSSPTTTTTLEPLNNNNNNFTSSSEPQESMGRSAGSGQYDFNRAQEANFLSSSQAISNTRHLVSSSSPQPISSSPSSTSIITPLNGPLHHHQQHHYNQLHQPQAHTTSLTATIGGGGGTGSGSGGAQESQSSMMKPLFVLGQPLSERDYSNTFPYDGSQAQPAVAEPAANNINNNNFKAPKVDSATPQTGDSIMMMHRPATGSGPQAASNRSSHSISTSSPSSRIDKSAEMNGNEPQVSSTEPALAPPNTSGNVGHLNQAGSDRMGGPPLVYSDGHLATVSSLSESQQQQQQQLVANGSSYPGSPSPRLYQAGQGAAVVGSNPRRPSLPPPVNAANAASGFRSPLSPSGPLIGGAGATAAASSPSLQPPVNSLASQQLQMPNFYQTSPPYAGASLGYPNQLQQQQAPPTMHLGGYNKPAYVVPQSTGLTGNMQAPMPREPQSQSQVQQMQLQQLPSSQQLPSNVPTSAYPGRRPLNITRVEHISAECSNELIRAVIVFNGTFKGIIYSSGYALEGNCMYVNGTGATRYEFNIRLNQCGTVARERLHQPTIPGEARRRDQEMWNTLSIQYNPIIEQEWDEHFRVSCEYGSDFWKTVSFNPFSVETNTGSPVVFTINPPQCQMDVLLGHGMGPKIAVDGPVTVGDPLTLLIHMKSEKAGYDILVKNCVAHNGAKQRMQLIDSNGCVVNERFISPFRGTYNDNDLRHVTLYAYLKAFRFTGSPVLYLECEIHMCQSACPPQMCYWRRLSKRSVDDFEYEYTTNSSALAKPADEQPQPVISDSLNLFKALQVRQEPERAKARNQVREIYAEDDEAALICYRHTEVCIFLITIASLLALVITIAITCCLRIRKLTRSQFEHNRLAPAGSLSPSLLSISDAISSVGSMVSGGAGPMTNGSCNKPNQALHSWHLHQHPSNNQTNNMLAQKQQCSSSTKPTLYARRPPAPPITSFQTRAFAYLPHIAR